MLFGQQNLSHFEDRPPKPKTSSEGPPLEEEQISHWYYALDEYEQCYVQVVAILHGAIAREIYQKVDAFYRIIQKQKYTVLETNSPSPGSLEEITSGEKQTLLFPRKPRLKLQESTYTMTRRVKGSECIFWQDASTIGQSLFESHVLSFLAKEFISKGEHWEHFLNTIEAWSSKRGESSWRAARALGVLLWYQDLSQFQRKAMEWAKKPSMSGQGLAASLLDAAREVELFTLQMQEVGTPVHQILREWTRNVQEKPGKTNINLGCAVAKAYSLIGKNDVDTETALQGVHALLEFQYEQENKDIHKLIGAIVSTHVNLTWSGHLRTVLHHLAITAEELVHHWKLPPQLPDRSRHRVQHSMRFKMTWKAFFLVAAAVSSEDQATSPDAYHQALEVRITIPDVWRRNIFLAAIVQHDSIETSIRIVLCSIIISIHNEQERKVAFELLYEWAKIIARFRQSPQPESKEMYDAFVQFLVSLGKDIDRWCQDLGQRGYRIPEANTAYKHKLEHWRDEGRRHNPAIEMVARDILVQLYSHSAL